MPANVRQLLRIDPGSLVVLLLATLAAWPFLTRPGLPTSTDAEHHVYRTYEIMSAWKQGVPYLRWAPDLFFGYGDPVFNYYAPLTYYLGAAYGWLCCGPAGGPVTGVRFVLVLSAYLGALGMYLLVRDRWNGTAGVVSAAAFVLAPYIVYMDPHARGAVPETFAVALGPCLLWAFARLLPGRRASPRDVILAAVILAALTLSHNLVSVLFIGLLLAWLAWELGTSEITPKDALWRKAIAILGATLLLGLGLSAFMWLPAALERGAVQFQRAFVDVAHRDIPLELISVRELLSPASMRDIADLSFSSWRFQLGVAQWVLGEVGILALVRTGQRRKTTLFFAVTALVMLFLILPASLGTWEAVPVLAYLQMPWRLLGPMAVVLGVLAGAALNWADRLPGQWTRVVIGSVAIIACIVTAMPLLDPLPWANYEPITPQRIFLAERNGVVENEFLPSSVIAAPRPQEALLRSYDINPVDKVNHATLPEGAQVTVVEHGPEHDRFQVTTPVDFVFRVFTYYFPGWTAYVDGVKAPIEIAQPEGFITLRVTAGAHDVRLRFEDTPPRWLGWAISGLAAVITLGLVVWHLRLDSKPLAAEPLEWRTAVVFGVVAFGGLGARYVADQTSPWKVDLPSYTVSGAQYQHIERLESNVALLAHDLPQTVARPGDQIPLTLYWKATGHVPLDLSVFVHFIGPDGQLWGQSDKVRPVADFPTDRWPLNRYFQDKHIASLRPDAPPGKYQVVVGLWDRLTGERRHALDANGAVTEADGIVLTTTFRVQP